MQRINLYLHPMSNECSISLMEVQYGDADLELLATDRAFTKGLSQTLVTKYRQRIQQLKAAPDERVLRSLKSLHFEKLQGKRSHQHSIRLNDQWRLILEFDERTTPKTVIVTGIEDYH